MASGRAEPGVAQIAHRLPGWQSKRPSGNKSSQAPGAKLVAVQEGLRPSAGSQNCSRPAALTLPPEYFPSGEKANAQTRCPDCPSASPVQFARVDLPELDRVVRTASWRWFSPSGEIATELTVGRVSAERANLFARFDLPELDRVVITASWRWSLRPAKTPRTRQRKECPLSERISLPDLTCQSLTELSELPARDGLSVRRKRHGPDPVRSVR
jgi:hypothetical protein